MAQRGEPRLVQVFVAQAAIETFDLIILLRLAGRDVLPLDLPVLRPTQDRQARQFGPVVAHDHQRLAANRNDRVELTAPGHAGAMSIP